MYGFQMNKKTKLSFYNADKQHMNRTNIKESIDVEYILYDYVLARFFQKKKRKIIRMLFHLLFVNNPWRGLHHINMTVNEFLNPVAFFFFFSKLSTRTFKKFIMTHNNHLNKSFFFHLSSALFTFSASYEGLKI